MNLTDKLSDCFEYEGKVFRLDMMFNNILKAFEMLDDDLFDEEEKLFIFLKMMIVNYDDVSSELSADELVSIMEFIIESFIQGDSEKSSGGTSNGEHLMDFTKDAGLIYSSFLMCYKMDLHEYRGKLHWNKFRELLTGLDKKTPFMEAVGFRQMKIPTGKDVSKEYKDYVMKMKAHYALEKIEDPESFNNALADTFNALKAIAKPKGGG